MATDWADVALDSRELGKMRFGAHISRRVSGVCLGSDLGVTTSGAGGAGQRFLRPNATHSRRFGPSTVESHDSTDHRLICISFQAVRKNLTDTLENTYNCQKSHTAIAVDYCI